MKRTRFTEEQIAYALLQAESGPAVLDVRLYLFDGRGGFRGTNAKMDVVSLQQLIRSGWI